MAMKINCSVLTPDRVLFEGQIDFAVVQAFDGEMGFLFNHAPLVAELGIGEARLRTAEMTEYLVVEGGFVEIKDNEMVVLAENAVKKSEIPRDKVESKLKELQAKERPKDLAEKFLLDVELKKLKTRLKVASR